MDNDSRIKKAFAMLDDHIDHEAFPPKFVKIMKDFAHQYIMISAEHAECFDEACARLKEYLHFVRENAVTPFAFEPYHEAIRAPYDFYDFAVEMVFPLVDKEHSTIESEKRLNTIEEQLEKGENVVLLANHQSEADPQALAILLRDKHPKLAQKLTFVAGDRVTSDPMAIPFSMGCNLLCIYSKRHIANPPEKKQHKLAHNQKTMGVLRSLLSEGGAFIYVAPSGGRDRKNQNGKVVVAPFDPGSIELFYLISKKAGTKTHFYPLALSTYSFLPPPPVVEKELGEERTINWCPIHARFLEEIDMENFPGSDIPIKERRRMARAQHIHAIVEKAHETLIS